MGRLWTHVRDDRPFGGKAAPAAVFYYSATREGEHAEPQLAAYTGICQADAHSGFNGLFVEGRQAGPIIEAACLARHGEAVLRTDAGASSSIWRVCAKCRSRSRPSCPSERCSRSRARSMVSRCCNVSLCVARDRSRWSKASRPGCEANAKSSPRKARSRHGAAMLRMDGDRLPVQPLSRVHALQSKSPPCPVSDASAITLCQVSNSADVTKISALSQLYTEWPIIWLACPCIRLSWQRAGRAE